MERLKFKTNIDLLKFSATDNEVNFTSSTYIRNLIIDLHKSSSNFISIRRSLKLDDIIDLIKDDFSILSIKESSYNPNEKVTLDEIVLINKDCDIFISLSTINKIEESEKLSIGCVSTIYKNHKETKSSVDKLYNSLTSLNTIVFKADKSINIISARPSGDLTTLDYKINFPKVNIDLNYNDEFKDIHNIIVDGLNNKNGLVLLHGLPGTGKTNYIKYLTSLIDKKLIFLPPNMTDQLSNPSLMNLLLSNKNSVLIIEDAENAIKLRQGNHTGQSVSNILNMSDGLLSDILNISIIATFNCNVNEIDSALLRKGRLLAKYEFGKLKKDKVQKLSNELGFKTIIDKDMTLSEIYNQEDKDFEKIKETIGFNFN